MHPSVMLCTYIFSCLSYSTVLPCTSDGHITVHECRAAHHYYVTATNGSDCPLTFPCHPLNYYVQSAASYFHFQHRVERGLLNRKLMKVTVLLRELRESMKKENHCFAHERRYRLKLPSYLIQACEEKKGEKYTEIPCLKHELMCARFVRCSLDQCDRVAGSCCIGYS